MPYFEDDNYLEKRIRGIRDSASTDLALTDWEGFMEKVRVEGFGAEWNENTWTKRLVCGLQSMGIPRCTFYNTTTMAQEFRTSLMDIFSLPCAYSCCFLFNGSPDVIVKKKRVLMSLETEPVDTDSEDDSLVENTFQRPPMKSQCSGIPEKTGQLIASLHTVLVAKVLRHLRKKKEIKRFFEVKGLLIDKVLGVIEVCVSVDMSNQSHKHPLNITVHDYTTKALDPRSLLLHITKLLE